MIQPPTIGLEAANPYDLLADADLAVTEIRAARPEGYSDSVQMALRIAIVGYLGGVVFAMMGLFVFPIFDLSLPWAFLGSVGAMFVARSGRTHLAAMSLLVIVALDIHFIIAVNGSALWFVVAGLSQAFIIVSNMWVGWRVSSIFLGIGFVTVPIAIHISGLNGASAGLFDVEGARFAALTLTNAAATQGLFYVFLRTVGGSLRSGFVAEQSVSRLLDRTPSALVILFPDGKIQAINIAAERAFGVQRRDIIGCGLDDLPVRDAAGESLQGAASGGTLKGTFECTAQNSGAVFELLARPFISVSGAPRTLLVMRDITAHREAVARADALQLQLNHAQKMEIVGQLAGGIAHDFNNLLTVLGGYGDMLSESSDPDVRGYGKVLRATHHNGATLVRQLLAFARRDENPPEVVDFAEKIRNIMPLVDRMVGSEVTARLDLTGSCPVRIRAGQMEQVLLNLAANARDAMPDGGAFNVLCHPVGDQIVLRVSDDGEGMDPTVLPRVFEPFFTTKSPELGTGLGLSILHRIVTEAGGSIAVKSAPGEGTEFEIVWPCAEMPSDAVRDSAA